MNYSKDRKYTKQRMGKKKKGTTLLFMSESETSALGSQLGDFGNFVGDCRKVGKTLKAQEIRCCS